ncbi:hypothetical protein GCM10028813_01310 [Ramlibacter alkalitolerans]
MLVIKFILFVIVAHIVIRGLAAVSARMDAAMGITGEELTLRTVLAVFAGGMLDAIRSPLRLTLSRKGMGEATRFYPRTEAERQRMAQTLRRYKKEAS